MNGRVVAPGDPAWDAAVERLAGDVYHLAAYHRVAEANGEGRAQAFLLEDGNELLFHPFLRRSIERVGDEDVSGRGWSDIETVYGYAGPLATKAPARGWDAFHDWCRAERVVAEFVRFDPLLGNTRFADPAMTVLADRETVVLDLTSDLWTSYPSVQRNMVRKAQAGGLEARVAAAPAGVDAFRAVYAETMARVGADPFYEFGAVYFDALAEQLGDAVHTVVVTRDGDIAAAALLLAHGTRLHYHLSGSRAWAQPLGATNLLLHAAAEWGRENGLRTFHLGGGRTAAPDDSLLRFKASVSRGRATFSTGRRVHDDEAYSELCDLWLSRSQGPRPAYFLVYRLPVS